MNFKNSVFPKVAYFFASAIGVFTLSLSCIGKVGANDAVSVIPPSSQVQVTKGKQESRFMGRYADVCGLARELAQKPFSAPALVPNALRSLSFDQWSQSSYKHKALQSIKGKFLVRPIVAGSIYETQTLLYGFDGEKSFPLRTYANEFNLPESVIQALPPEISQLAGFQLLNAANQKFLFEFLGATYFRGAANGTFGTSTLGLCLFDENLTMTVFPRFTTFWIVPGGKQKEFRLFALMDSSFVTGAYEFSFPYKTLAYIQVRCAFF